MAAAISAVDFRGNTLLFSLLGFEPEQFRVTDSRTAEVFEVTPSCVTVTDMNRFNIET